MSKTGMLDTIEVGDAVLFDMKQGSTFRDLMEICRSSEARELNEITYSNSSHNTFLLRAILLPTEDRKRQVLTPQTAHPVQK